MWWIIGLVSATALYTWELKSNTKKTNRKEKIYNSISVLTTKGLDKSTIDSHFNYIDKQMYYVSNAQLRHLSRRGATKKIKNFAATILMARK